MTNNPTEYSLQELKNLSADTSVSPPIPREGMLGKDSDGSYRNILVDQEGNIAPALNLLTETLQELSQRLMPLAGAMSNTAQLRAVVTGAVTATGGGYITSAQEVAALLTQTTSLIAYYRQIHDNTLVTQANINNCVVT